jgi:hypothetical protein
MWGVVAVATRGATSGWKTQLKWALSFFLFYLLCFRKFFDEDEVGMLLVLVFPALELLLLILIAATWAKARIRDRNAKL